MSSDYARGWSKERRVDQVVVEHGTAPLDELYLALRPLSSNLGVVDYAALIAGESGYDGGARPDPFPSRNSLGAFVVLRIGDAVASRNIHAAVYDGMRYALRV